MLARVVVLGGHCRVCLRVVVSARCVRLVYVARSLCLMVVALGPGARSPLDDVGSFRCLCASWFCLRLVSALLEGCM